MDSINCKNTILVVDDDEEIASQISMLLQDHGYESKYVTSGLQALAQVELFKPQLILLDFNMPDFDGLATLKTLRSRSDYISVVFVSGEPGETTVIQGLDEGADDFLRKPIHAEELLARVRCQLRIRALRDQLKLSNEKLKEMVNKDELTGLYNMRSIYEKLEEEIKRAQRSKSQICALMVDMDNFKEVNDRADHIFGSDVLAQMGKIFTANMRISDLAARYGGDEFLIVMPDSDEEGGKHFAQKLQKMVEQMPQQKNPYGVHISISIGITVVNPSLTPIDSKQLVRKADQALYLAKKSGRNCFKMASSHL